MHVPSAILHAIGWFCNHVVRLAYSIQQLSAQLAQVALPLLPWHQNHENRLNYKLLKYFFCHCLSFLNKNPQHHSCGLLPAYFTAAQSSSEALTGPHTHTQNKRTGRRTDGQGICRRWQSHSSFQSYPRFNRMRVTCWGRTYVMV